MGAGPQAERDTGFSRAEIDMLRLRLDEIKAFLVERTSPSPSGVHHITVNINYLSDRAAHVSKLDWKNLLVGCLISIAVNLTVDRDAFRDMMGLAAQYFLPLLGMDLPLPLPPGS
jgi:hypothetical protein